jgi:hypothetical protein
VDVDDEPLALHPLFGIDPMIAVETHGFEKHLVWHPESPFGSTA